MDKREFINFAFLIVHLSVRCFIFTFIFINPILLV